MTKSPINLKSDINEKMVKKQIVFVEPKLSIASSTFKIARALKLRGGYETVLVSFTKVDEEFAKKAFDKIFVLEIDLTLSPRKFFGLFDLFKKLFDRKIYAELRKIKELKPYVIQVRGASITTLLSLLLIRKYPKIYYLQDIWQYYYKKITLSLLRGEGRSQILNVLISYLSCKNCDGILNRSGENSLQYMKDKIKIPILDFLPYCLDEWIIPIKKKALNKESQSQQAVGYSLSLKLGNNCRSKLRGITTPSLSNKNIENPDNYATVCSGFSNRHPQNQCSTIKGDVYKEIHMVYIGTTWNKWKGHASFPDVINKIIAQKIHLHLYPSSISKDLKNILEGIAKNNPYFHLYSTQNADKINKIISKYDYAVHPDFYDDSINKLWTETGMSAKIFGYIEAGLPIIINRQFKNMCNIIEKNKMGFGITYRELEKLKEILSKYKYPSLKTLKNAQENFKISKKINVLEDFYDKIHTIKYTTFR